MSASFESRDMIARVLDRHYEIRGCGGSKVLFDVVVCPGGLLRTSVCMTEAKLAAENHWRERIEQALEPVE